MPLSVCTICWYSPFSSSPGLPVGLASCGGGVGSLNLCDKLIGLMFVGIWDPLKLPYVKTCDWLVKVGVMLWELLTAAWKEWQEGVYISNKWHQNNMTWHITTWYMKWHHMTHITWHHTISYHMTSHMTWHHTTWHDIWHDVIWHDMIYDMISDLTPQKTWNHMASHNYEKT